MCCVIFEGKKCCSQTGGGIDFTVKVDNNSNYQQEFIENNFEHEKNSFEWLTAEDKLYSGGPTCMFKGKIVPCFTRWSELWSMSSIICSVVYHFVLLCWVVVWYI